MSKKNKNSLSATENITDEEANKTVKDNDKTDKVKKQENKKNKTKKGGKEKKDKTSLKKKTKETLSELKKVTWPSFGEVCKKTGVVLVVVLVFAVIIFGIDYGLGALMKLLTNR